MKQFDLNESVLVGKMRVATRQVPGESVPSRAPGQSVQHLRLRKAARRAGQNEEILRNLLWLINAHDQLIGLGQIARNLITILKPDEEYRPGGVWRDEMGVFSGWTGVLEWIVEVCPKDLVSASGRNPITGHGLTRHPFYASLWHQPANNRWSKQYAGLQFHFLCAHAIYLYKETIENKEGPTCRSAYESWSGEEMWEAFPNSPYDATRHVRALASPDWSPLLRVLPVRTLPFEFPEQLNSVRCPMEVPESLRAKWLLKRTQLAAFLAKANNPALWIQREGNTGPRSPATSVKSRGWIRSIDIALGDQDDPDACWPDGRLVRHGQLGEARREELLELDLNPEEIAEPAAFYLVEQENFDQQDEAIRSALAARGQCRHMQLANQLLPWEYGQLTLQELAWLLRQASRSLRSLPAPALWNQTEWFTAELIAMTHVMLWTGSSLERAWSLKVLDKSDKGEYRRRQVLESSLLFELDTHQWRIHAESPEYRSEIVDHEQQAYSREVSFVLPDMARTETFLQKLRPRSLKSLGSQDPELKLLPNLLPDFKDGEYRKGRSDEGFLFTGGLETYRAGLRKWLKDGSNDLTGRLTIGRLSSFLFNRLTAVTGDVTAAVAVTGQDHPLAHTQLFYSTWNVSEIQKIYSKATGTIVEQAYLAANLPPPRRLVDPPMAAESYVGARLCARPDAVRRAVLRLQEDLIAKKAITDRAGSITHHNLYTLYTVLLFGYSTSMRAIRTPYLISDRVDRISGFAFLSDKDDDAEHKARLAWVPPFVIDQMEAYSDHISALASDNPLIPTDYVRACYFLDGEGAPLEVKPLSLSAHMEPYLRLPPNAHRRFMRKELYNGGCPPEVISAWLGHASLGEEPAGPYSSFSFFEYRAALELYLLPILEELGWKTLTSPLC